MLPQLDGSKHYVPRTWRTLLLVSDTSRLDFLETFPFTNLRSTTLPPCNNMAKFIQTLRLSIAITLLAASEATAKLMTCTSGQEAAVRPAIQDATSLAAWSMAAIDGVLNLDAQASMVPDTKVLLERWFGSDTRVDTASGRKNVEYLRDVYGRAHDSLGNESTTYMCHVLNDATLGDEGWVDNSVDVDKKIVYAGNAVALGEGDINLGICSTGFCNLTVSLQDKLTAMRANESAAGQMDMPSHMLLHETMHLSNVGDIHRSEYLNIDHDRTLQRLTGLFLVTDVVMPWNEAWATNIDLVSYGVGRCQYIALLDTVLAMHNADSYRESRISPIFFITHALTLAVLLMQLALRLTWRSQ